MRSTSQAGAPLQLGLGDLVERDLQFVELSLRASSTRGAWLVGPMNIPENR